MITESLTSELKKQTNLSKLTYSDLLNSKQMVKLNKRMLAILDTIDFISESYPGCIIEISLSNGDSINFKPFITTKQSFSILAPTGEVLKLFNVERESEGHKVHICGINLDINTIVSIYPKESHHFVEQSEILLKEIS